jgi:hypothetical protein
MKRFAALLERAAAVLPRPLHDRVVVFGSVPMALAGLRADVTDLDLFVSEATFAELIAQGFPCDKERPEVPRILLAEDVEVFKTWLGAEFAEVYAASVPHGSSCGLRVADLRHVYAFKVARNRQKDQKDIEVLCRTLALKD